MVAALGQHDGVAPGSRVGHDRQRAVKAEPAIPGPAGRRPATRRPVCEARRAACARASTRCRAGPPPDEDHRVVAVLAARWRPEPEHVARCERRATGSKLTADRWWHSSRRGGRSHKVRDLAFADQALGAATWTRPLGLLPPMVPIPDRNAWPPARPTGRELPAVDQDERAARGARSARPRPPSCRTPVVAATRRRRRPRGPPPRRCRPRSVPRKPPAGGASGGRRRRPRCRAPGAGRALIRGTPSAARRGAGGAPRRRRRAACRRWTGTAWARCRGVLERGQADEPPAAAGAPSGRRRPVPSTTEPGSGPATGSGPRRRGRRRPRLVGVLVLTTHPHADTPGPRLGLGHQGPSGPAGPVQAGHERPGRAGRRTAGARRQSNRLSPLAAAPLQRQGDQVAEAAGRHGVLAREHTSRGGEPDSVGPPLPSWRSRSARVARLARGGQAAHGGACNLPTCRGSARAQPGTSGGGASEEGERVARPVLAVEVGGERKRQVSSAARADPGREGCRPAAARGPGRAQVALDDACKRPG